MKKLNILAIVAHSADTFDMIGGTLSNHAERGDEVVVAIMNRSDTTNNFRLADDISKGRIDGGSDSLAAAAELHNQSMLNACKILGLKDVRFLQYSNEMLTVDDSLVDQVATMFQELRPHLVITHNPMEDAGACDHAACGRIVIEAMHLAEGARANGLPAHHLGQVYFFCPSGNTNWLDATHTQRYGSILIDVTRQIEKKVRAYAQLHAQYITMHRAAKIVEGICGGEPSIHNRVAYTEEYQPFRQEVYDCLPISQHNVDLSEGTWEQGLDNLRLIAPYLKGVEK